MDELGHEFLHSVSSAVRVSTGSQQCAALVVSDPPRRCPKLDSGRKGQARFIFANRKVQLETSVIQAFLEGLEEGLYALWVPYMEPSLR